MTTKVNNKEMKNGNLVPFCVAEMCWTGLDKHSQFTFCYDIQIKATTVLLKQNYLKLVHTLRANEDSQLLIDFI